MHGNERSKRSIVGLGLMPYAGKYSVAKPSDATYQEYLKSLVTFAQWLLVHDYDIRLLIGEVSDSSASEEFKVSAKSIAGSLR